MYYLLFYDFTENVIERRAPYREEHLKLAREFVERGRLVLGGTFADPIDGAVLIFKAEDRATVEEFVQRDPYIAGGVVTAWRIRPWTVGVGTAV